MKIEFEPIGLIHTPFTSTEGMPIQPAGAEGIAGTVEVFAGYAEGLADIDGFSHLILLYHLNRSRGYKLKVVPFLDTAERGVFATRAPRRPNPIGLSVVRLKKREGAILHIENVDILDNTPLLDIKPYVPEFDREEEIATGWLEEAAARAKQTRADRRFHRD